ncbi:MAG: alanine-phosphoribitol ligase [Frankiales bacterium]|nr:alanine-phosphoribitol ligase [Frankiales bacterium]
MRNDPELSYDYIVVGGGTAGCVVAARVGSAGASVLLVEAGPPDRNPLIHIPAGYGKLRSGQYSRYEWPFSSIPQVNCDARTIPLPQGRVIGGGGSINAQVFTRGVRADYDHWAESFGCDGWSFDDIEQFFLRAERNEILGPPSHGMTGALGVSSQANPHPLSRAFVLAGQQYGLPYRADFNAGQQIGVGLYQSTTASGRRCSTAVGYLRPARRTGKVALWTGTLASRILLHQGRATGIEVIRNGRTVVVGARCEVILAAGAYNSPKLLQMSGIGDPKWLEQAGVKVRHALPGVGRNLHDHYSVTQVLPLTHRVGMDRYQRATPRTALALGQYLLFRGGPFASTVVEAGGFAAAPEGSDRSPIQFCFMPAAVVRPGSPVRRGLGMTINSWFTQPRSRGSVKIRSADPLAAPVIDPNYLSDAHDLKMSAHGVDMALEIMSQPAFAEHLDRERFRAMLADSGDTHRIVRQNGRSSAHPVGTCAMGNTDLSVVSAELLVHGISSLRVADASVMPSIVSSNTQAPTVMIAEKAADLISAT